MLEQQHDKMNQCQNDTPDSSCAGPIWFAYGMRYRSGRGQDQVEVLPSLIFQNHGNEPSPHSKFSPGPVSGRGISPTKYGNQFTSPLAVAPRQYPGEVPSGPRSSAKSTAGTPSRGLPRRSMIQRENDWSTGADGMDMGGTPDRSHRDNDLSLTTRDESLSLLSSEGRGVSLSTQRSGGAGRSSRSSRYLHDEDIHGAVTMHSFPTSGGSDLSGGGKRYGGDNEVGTPLGSDLVVTNPLSVAESQWPHWVVVFGFNPNVDHGSTSSLQNLLRIFQEFGEIDDYSVSPGNWLFIKYMSPSQAERAIANNGTFLSNHIMIGVQGLTARRAKDMNVSIETDGRMVHRGAVAGGALSREGAEGAAARRHLDPDYDSIMRPPKRKKDICTRIFEYFMVY